MKLPPDSVPQEKTPSNLHFHQFPLHLLKGMKGGLSVVLFLLVMATRAVGQCETSVFTDAELQNFGTALAIDGEVAIVGAPHEDPRGNGEATGAAHIYRKRGGVWVEEQVLTASNGLPNDSFGLVVDIAGDVAIVGMWAAPLFPQSPNDPGFAYIYRFDPTCQMWVEEAILANPFPIPGSPNDEQSFGLAVAIRDEIAVVKSSSIPSDACTFERMVRVYRHQVETSTWVEEALFSFGPESSSVRLRHMIDIRGNRIFVGRWNELGQQCELTGGSVHVLWDDGGAWVEEAVLHPAGVNPDDAFGGALDASGEVLVVGASGDGDLGSFAGTAYVFRHQGVNWVQEAKLLAPDGGASDFFGSSVSISGSTILIGAPGDDDLGVDAGAAYRFQFDPTSTSWVFSEKLLASDGGPDKRYGRVVAAGGMNFLVGTGEFNNVTLFNPGAAYFLTQETGIDCNNNGVSDGCDIASGVSMDLNGDGVPDECPADCNGNGVNDVKDIAGGVSQDINQNGLPDECERDCDGNGLPDAYELANGLGTDCNLNLVLDACEIACIPEADTNNNQIHDACETQALNDTCFMFMGISPFQTSLTFTNAFTTNSGFNEPCGAFESDVWFSYLLLGTGTLTVSVCDANFDTELAIYPDQCPTGPNEALACSQDDCGTGSSLSLTVIPKISFTRFKIRVGGKNGQQGSGTLVFNCEPLCPEDVGPRCGDGLVDIGDLTRVIDAFGGACDGCREDITPPGGNGVVNIDDLVAVLNAFGACP